MPSWSCVRGSGPHPSLVLMLLCHHSSPCSKQSLQPPARTLLSPTPATPRSGSWGHGQHHTSHQSHSSVIPRVPLGMALGMTEPQGLLSPHRLCPRAAVTHTLVLLPISCLHCVASYIRRHPVSSCLLPAPAPRQLKGPALTVPHPKDP